MAASMWLQMALFRSFPRLSSSPLYVCATSLPIQPVDGHSVCFFVLAVVMLSYWQIVVTLSNSLLSGTVILRLVWYLLWNQLCLQRLQFPLLEDGIYTHGMDKQGLPRWC